jgi:RNA polymerase sigma-70 factor, ECF subfamily
VSLSEVDRQLLQRCIDGAPQAWQNFVDRFLGLVVHVANHAASNRNLTLDAATRDDLVAEVFLALIQNDYATLRRFRRNCSLATYLTVIARRVIVRKLAGSTRQPGIGEAVDGHVDERSQRLAADNEEVQQMMLRLDPQEANVVRMFHLEGKSYREISQAVGLSENSIGPMLSRAKAKMRNGHA